MSNIVEKIVGLNRSSGLLIYAVFFKKKIYYLCMKVYLDRIQKPCTRREYFISAISARSYIISCYYYYYVYEFERNDIKRLFKKRCSVYHKYIIFFFYIKSRYFKYTRKKKKKTNIKRTVVFLDSESRNMFVSQYFFF